MSTILIPSQQKVRKNEVNAIEKVYVQEGIYSKTFTHQLLDYISYVLNRYSNGNSFPDDLIHFTYLRVVDRLGMSVPEPPPFSPDNLEEVALYEKWLLEGKKCQLDLSRSNLGNYIFSIARHAHSNWMYHDSKKFKELEPPATELPEPEVVFEINEDLKSRVLEINENEEVEEYMPECLRRYRWWKIST